MFKTNPAFRGRKRYGIHHFTSQAGQKFKTNPAFRGRKPISPSLIEFHFHNSLKLTPLLGDGNSYLYDKRT